MDAPPPAPLWRRLLIPCACLLLLVVVAWVQRPDGRLHVFVLAAPGDAALIQTPAGRFVLIDGGRDPAILALLLGQHIPFWRRDLLAVLLTARDGQRLPGQVAALARYTPALALASPALGTRGTADEWRRLVAEQATPTHTLRAGQSLKLDGATLSVLAATPGDEGGAVLLLSYGATRVLFHTGGSAGDAAALEAAGRPLNLLVYPWQREPATPAVLALRPRAIVFTQAYEAPEPALLSYADRRRYSPRLFHPANDGSVELLSDGRQAWIVASTK